MQRLMILTFILILPAVAGCLGRQRAWGWYGDPCGCATYDTVPSYGTTVVPSVPSITTELPGPVMTTPAMPSH